MWAPTTSRGRHVIVSDLGCVFFDVDKKEREIAVREKG